MYNVKHPDAIRLKFGDELLTSLTKFPANIHLDEDVLKTS